MATTSPDNIRTPNPGDPYNLVADQATSAQDTQNALTRRANLYVGTAAQRAAFTTAPTGVNWQDTDGMQARYVRIASSWVMQGDKFYSGTAAQRTAFTNAPNGSQWQDTDGVKALWTRDGSTWVSGDTGWVNITSFGSGWSADTSYLPRVRKKGGVIYGEGRVTGPVSSGTSLTLPVGFRPANMKFFLLERGSPNAIGRLTLSSAGTLSLSSSTGVAGSAMSLDQLIFPEG